MNAHQADFPVRTMCRVLGVSHRGLPDWHRPPSRRAIDDAVLTERFRRIHAESPETYGRPRIRAGLAEQGARTGGHRIARLMGHAGLHGISKRRAFAVTTRRDDRQRPAPELVDRNFKADRPNALWVADMTYVPTWGGFIDLPAVMDVFGRRIVGWSMGERMTSEGKAHLFAGPCRRAVIERWGHVPQREHPELVSQRVLGWLGQSRT